ncbi:unnamed protein product [Arctia plantaginis]|uniref:Ommochrome-binding protein-like n=1 Tax=Arctia plantaginis TaxID=874455 RepID=A0A8S1AWD7_ARCPL|nr:unnamed protein product [Arctia plantaginis]
MYFLLLFLSARSSIAQSDINVVCDGVVFNGQYYDKQLLFKDFGRSYNLVMHEATGQLFFSHAVNNDTYSFRKIKSCDIHNKTCNAVMGINGGNAIFYDQQNNELYFGGYDGVYKYNFMTNKAEILHEKGMPIWDLFINNKKIYFITYKGKNLYVYKDNSFDKVQEVADVQVENFFITKHSKLYFSNDTGLYMVENHHIPFDPAILIKNNVTVRQITEDIYGNAYFCAKDGIYIDDLVSGSIKQLAHIDDLSSIVLIPTGVYSNNIIYSDKDAIYSLSPSRYGYYCYNSTQSDQKEN